MIVELSGHIVTHLTSNFHVVSPDKCRIFTVSLAVEEDNRNAFLHSFVDNRRNGMGLIGRDNQQIDTVFYELFYLLDLSFIVIVGRSKPHRHTVFHVSGRPKLLIELVTPNVFRTL